MARLNCLMLLAQVIRRAASRACCIAGSNRAINSPMMAIATSSSMSEKPRDALRWRW